VDHDTADEDDHRIYSAMSCCFLGKKGNCWEDRIGKNIRLEEIPRDLAMVVDRIRLRARQSLAAKESER
jgi:hypothetical protein